MLYITLPKLSMKTQFDTSNNEVISFSKIIVLQSHQLLQSTILG